jgi:hypothetical protein
VKRSEWQPHLGWKAVRPQHTSPARSPQRASNIQESRLPDPGLPADDQAAAMFARAPEQALKHCHLANTSDECGHPAASRRVLMRHGPRRHDGPDARACKWTIFGAQRIGSIYVAVERNAYA